LGDNYRRLGKYDTSFVLLTSTIDTALHQLGEMHASTAMAINKLGLWYRDNGEYEKALEYFNRALSIRLKVLPPDHMDIGWSYNNIGLVQYDNGNFDSALRSYQKVIPIFIKNLGEKSAPLALLYNNIAATLQVKGNQEKALEYHNLAIEMRIRLFGHDHITLAQSYENIANIYIRKGDYDKAFKFLNRALSIRIRNLGEYHPDIAQNYYNLGFTYKESGQSDEALRSYKKALMIYEKNFGHQHPLVARVCDEIGGRLLAQDKYDSALFYFKRALLIWTEGPGVKGFLRAYVLSHIGTTYLKKGNFNDALRLYEQALSVNKEYYGEKHLEVSQSYSDITEAYMSVRNYEQALRYNSRAIDALVLSDSRNVAEIRTVNAVKLLLALDMKGDILNEIYYKKTMRQENLRWSFSAYESAVLWLDKIRREYSSEDSKLLLGQKMNRIFEKGIRTAYALFALTGDSLYAEKAFLFSEKSKVAILTEAIKDEQAKIFAGIPDSLLDYENQLRASIGFYDKKLFAEQNEGGFGSKKYRTIQDKIFELTTEYEKHLRYIEQSYPQYYDLKYRSSVLSLKEVQKNIPDSVVLLEYFLGDQQTFVFCIDNKEYRWIALDKDSTILKQVNNMRRGIEIQDFKSYSESAYYLYNRLISPIRITNAAHLIIIPDGPLATIPFEALLTKPAGDKIDYSNLAYLIKDLKISYAYSSTLLYQNLDLQTNLKNNLIGFSPSIFK
ncbi:tetratricopeptide repeat protein, partial [bacterium]|nr:tetratricopeptide repeat protein [bacterium]